jgi:hypothetical protein
MCHVKKPSETLIVGDKAAQDGAFTSSGKSQQKITVKAGADTAVEGIFGFERGGADRCILDAGKKPWMRNLSEPQISTLSSNSNYNCHRLYSAAQQQTSMLLRHPP